MTREFLGATLTFTVLLAVRADPVSGITRDEAISIVVASVNFFVLETSDQQLSRKILRLNQ